MTCVIDGNDTQSDVGPTVAAGRVCCPLHNPCPTGTAKWADVRRYGGDAARFAFVTGMWIARGWPGAHAPLVEREFIVAHRTDERRAAEELQVERARAMRQRGHSQRRNPAEGARAEVVAG